MTTDTNIVTLDGGFEQTASYIEGLAVFQDLFDSCAQLMADALVNNGKIFSVGSGISALCAQQLADLLILSPDAPRPPLPAIFLDSNPLCIQRIEALGQQGDFAIFFGGPEPFSHLEPLLDSCLERSLTSILINPDLSPIETTDKALEIRLEYRTLADYMTSLSAVCNYLTTSIEKQLFGRQT